MTDELRIKAEIFLNNYNAFMRESYDAYIKTQAKFNDNQELFDNANKEAAGRWEETIIPELDNMTPKEFTDNFNSINELIELYELVSKDTFDEIPHCLIKKIVSYGNEAAEILINKFEEGSIENYDFDSNDNCKQVEFNLFIIKILGEKGFGQEGIIKKLLDYVSLCSLSNSVFLEKIALALTNRIDESHSLVVGYINETKIMGEKEEYLLSALCGIENQYKNDEIYKCLKTSFLRMANRILGAIFLGDYGDPRAIPMLRRFAKEKADLCSKEEYYAVLAVIDKLGGLIDDLLPDSIE